MKAARKPVLRMEDVNIEDIYSSVDREKDIGKMKTYFEIRMNPM